MQLYNTLSRRVEELNFPSGEVKLYVCGVTPYDTSHLGHARVGVVYDTLRRYLESQGLRVRYVQNVTDIDEPLFDRARRDGVDWRVLGEQQTQRYLDSLARLNVSKPEYYVRATSVIPQMQATITKLLEQEYAYVSNGAVYYHAASNPDFGALAHANPQTLLAMANEMGNNPNDPNKRDPLDFVLWQPSAPDEPAWDSPWGSGRPGWHIECSTLATEYLGPQVDIHGGGTDLIFPHHACEIAQSEPATGVAPFVRCWMHTGLVALGGTKMSKSLGNMVFVDEVLAVSSPNALRLAILSYPYGEPFEYSAERVAQVEQQVDAVTAALGSPSGTGRTFDGAEQQERFFHALADNFDTPSAIIAMSDLAEAISRSAEAGRNVRASQQALLTLTDVLGCKFMPPAWH
jgi:L-cysteine:1D-myo-inositol 2-amino-2-deoxy-alpha-D-glucopyranoside ligase